MTTVDAALAPPAPLARTVPRFLGVAVQLGLLLGAVYLLRIEPNRLDTNRPFFVVFSLAAAGFLVHAWLPRRWRPAFFALLSMATVVLLLGWADGACVL